MSLIDGTRAGRASQLPTSQPASAPAASPAKPSAANQRLIRLNDGFDTTPVRVPTDPGAQTFNGDGIDFAQHAFDLQSSPFKGVRGTFTSRSAQENDSYVGPDLQPYRSFTVTGESGYQIQLGGSAKGFSVDGQSMSGIRSTYTIDLPASQAGALASGKGKLPNPFDPSTLPQGASVLLKGEDFQNTQLSASFDAHALSVSVGGGSDSANGIGMRVTKTGPNTVRVQVGQVADLQRTNQLGISAFGLSGTQSASFGTMRTVDLDLSSPAGQAAYNAILLHGQFPAADEPGAGISSVGTARAIDLSSQSGLTVFGQKVGGDSSSARRTETRYADGSSQVDLIARSDGGGISAYQSQRYDPNGNPLSGSGSMTFTLHDLAPEQAYQLNAALSGSLDVSRPGSDQSASIQLDPAGAAHLQQLARREVDDVYRNLGQPPPSSYDPTQLSSMVPPFVARLASANGDADVATVFLDQPSENVLAQNLFDLARTANETRSERFGTAQFANAA